MLPTVLDIGCGIGEPMGRYLIEQGCSLTGVDFGAGDDRHLREPPASADMAGSGYAVIVPGRSLQRHPSLGSFFHLCHDDQRRMFPVFRAHAAPRAMLIFTSGPAYGEAMGTFEGEPLYHASLDSAEYRALLDENGFAVVAHPVEDWTCGRHTIWLAQPQ